MSFQDNIKDLEDFGIGAEDTLKDRYLSFKIDDDFYAIDILYITEIIGIQKITQVPHLKSFVKGIINLRGNIIPVLNVRNRFSLNEIDYNDRTCIIVVKLEETTVGLIVDEVSEVFNIPVSQITESPTTNKGNHSRFIRGIGKVDSKVVILLDIIKLLYDDDFSTAVIKEYQL